MPPRRRARNAGHDLFPLLLLFGQLQEIGLNRIPPVTLIFFVINVAVYFLAAHIPLSEVCIRPVSVTLDGEYERLILSAFFHADTWHLYYNMASLLWKGLHLERKIGSSRLFFLIIISSVMSSILYVFISLALANAFNDQSFYSCAVGFSAVLFTLKVVVNYDSNTYSTYFGMTIPAKYLCWFELVLISIVTPNASFLGHLCGILVGVMYVIGIFNPVFKITDLLGVDRVFSTIQSGYRYDQHAVPPTQPRGHRMGGAFGRMPRGYGSGYGYRSF